MSKVINVKFGKQTVFYDFVCEDDIKLKDSVVCETKRGVELGKIRKIIDTNDFPNFDKLPKITRKAKYEDIRIFEENLIKEKKYSEKAKKIILELGLDMKVIETELMLDRKKVVFSFYSDNRVDFRELLKRLAGEFKIKIELRQIGLRDEVKILGGIGVCGLECCCKRNPKDLESVSIKMAKTQGLPLNPSNISGICGKLKCCLSYENEFYAESVKNMPKVNSEVQTPDGMGKVLYNNIPKQTVQVKVGEALKEYPLVELKFHKTMGAKNG